MVVHSFKSLRSTSADAAAAEPPIILDVLEEAPTPKIVSKREEQQTQKQLCRVQWTVSQQSPYPNIFV